MNTKIDNYFAGTLGRIMVQPHNAVYDEFPIDPEIAGTDVLPGMLLYLGADSGGKPVLKLTGSGIPYVVIENVYVGKTINHAAKPGDVTPVYRPVAGDILYVRAAQGAYTIGTPLTISGNQVAEQSGAAVDTDGVTTSAGDTLYAHAQEVFTVPASASSAGAGNMAYIPNMVDDSEGNSPSSVDVANTYTNLLRVQWR